MTRHEIREEVFKIIFGLDLHEEEDILETIEKYMQGSCDVDLKDSEYKAIVDKAAAVGSMIAELDEEINAIAEGWTTNRMGKAELNIIRLAVYEIKHDDAVPVKVAINEAIELSKVYCNDDAPAFINGMLAHFA